MTYAEIMALLQANNQKNSGYLTINELKALTEQFSVDLPKRGCKRKPAEFVG